MSATLLRPLTGMAACLIVASCQGTLPSKPPPDRSGGSSVEALPAEDSRRYHLAPGDAVEQPVAIDNAPPQYPADLLAQNLPPQQFDVRLVIDERGAVRECQALAPADAPSLPNPFYAAIRAAVLAWRFTPLRVTSLVDVDEDGDGEADAVRQGPPQARPFSLDYRFRFAVVDGKAQVRQDPRRDTP